MMRGVKAVLFDLDETLIDAKPGVEAAYENVAKVLGRYLAQARIGVSERLLRSKLKEIDDRMNLITEYDRDAWWPALLDAIGVKRSLPRALIAELTRIYWSSYERASEPYAEAESSLAYLKGAGYKLGLVTDTDRRKEPKARRIKRLGLARYFDVIVVGGEDTPRTKPSPEPFELASTKLGLGTSECAFVGDKPFTDIRGAKSAGMVTVWLKRRDWGIEERADFEIDSLAQLRSIF